MKLLAFSSSNVPYFLFPLWVSYSLCIECFLLSIISSNISTLNTRHHPPFEVFPDLHAVVLVSTCHLCTRPLDYYSSCNAYYLFLLLKCDLVGDGECVLNHYLQQLSLCLTLKMYSFIQ